MPRIYRGNISIQLMSVFISFIKTNMIYLDLHLGPRFLLNFSLWAEDELSWAKLNFRSTFNTVLFQLSSSDALGPFFCLVFHCEQRICWAELTLSRTFNAVLSQLSLYALLTVENQTKNRSQSVKPGPEHQLSHAKPGLKYLWTYFETSTAPMSVYRLRNSPPIRYPRAGPMIAIA